MLLWCQVNCPKISAWRWIKYCLISIRHPCQSMGGKGGSTRQVWRKEMGNKGRQDCPRSSEPTKLSWMQSVPSSFAGGTVKHHQHHSAQRWWEWSTLCKNCRGDGAFGWPWPWPFTKENVDWSTCLPTRAVLVLYFLYFYRENILLYYFLYFYRVDGGWCSWFVFVARVISR